MRDRKGAVLFRPCNFLFDCGRLAYHCWVSPVVGVPVQFICATCLGFIVSQHPASAERFCRIVADIQELDAARVAFD